MSTKHKYIDVSKLYDFSETGLTLDSIADDLEYHRIINIANEEGIESELQCICEQLLDDYENHRANYKAYLEPDMNARLFTELRNSAILPLSEEYYSFYTDHCKITSQKEVLDYRNNFISSMIPEYKGLEWQYYVWLRTLWGRKGKNILIDFETLFIDGENRAQHWKAYYRMKFLEQHLPKEVLEHAYLDDIACF